MKRIIIEFFLLYLIYQEIVPKSNAEKMGPCTDFYEYACRNYSSANMAEELENQFNGKVLNFLLSSDPVDVSLKEKLQEFPFFNSVISYFQSCRNEKKNLTKYLGEIRNCQIFSDINMWSLLGELQTCRNENNLTKYVNEIKICYMPNDIKIWFLLGEMQSYSLNDIILNNKIEKYNSVPEITLTINDSIYLPASNELKELLKIQDLDDIDNKIQDLYDLQRQWKAMNSRYLNSTESFSKKRYRFKDIAVYLQEYIKAMTGVKISKYTYIYLKNPRFFEYLIEKTKESTNEEFKRMTLYLNTIFLHHLKENTPKQFTDQQCYNDLFSKFEPLKYEIYIIRYLLENIEENFMNCVNLFKKINSIMIKLIQENHLNLSDEQLHYVIEKIKKVSLDTVKHPHFKYEDFYINLPLFNDTNYYRNNLILLKYQTNYSKYNEPMEVYDTNNFTSTMPFYNKQENAIKLPFKTFQLPFFEYQQNFLQKISLMGFILARELTKITDRESLFKDRKKIAKSIIQHENFNNSLKCLEEQESVVNLNDRIADLIAVRVAYRTFEEYYAKGQTKGRRRFFKNMAKLFCGQNEENDSKDTDKIRLLELVKNFEPFAEAFQCPKGSPMNPLKKCRIY